MGKLRQYIPSLLILVALAIAIPFLYGSMQPMAFLLGAGILFMILYFFIVFFTARNINPLQVPRQASVYSVIFFLFLFGISMKVMNDYQLPKDDYFTNIDHHTIKNTGIAFKNNITLYHEKSDTSTAIWPSESGDFTIQSNTANGINFQFKNFYKPVLGINNEKIYLANPLYQLHVSNGFTIGDDRTSLTWIDFSSQLIRNVHPRYSFKIVLHTTDPYFSNQADSSFSYRDTITINDIEIRKGLDLRSIFKTSEEFKEPFVRQVFTKYLDRSSKIYLVPDLSKANNPGLHFFPSHDFTDRSWVSFNGQKINPARTLSVPFTSSDPFYVGVENSRKLLRLRNLDTTEKILAGNANHFLELNDFSSYALKAVAPSQLGINKAQIRFLKNNYQQLGLNEIREGFLFHDDINSNGYTGFDAIIRYFSGPAGTPLDYSLIGSNVSKSIKGKNNFSILSRNGSLSWFFKIDDLSHNPYDFSHSRWYLAVLALAILALLIYYPGKELHLIETPVLMVVYLFMTFRLLLLWRVATFPPLTNISTREYDSLQNFDMRFLIPLPIPFSLICVLAPLLFIFIYRWRKERKQNQKFQIQSKKEFKLLKKWSAFIPNPAIRVLVVHTAVLIICLGSKYFLPVEQLIRISKILIPIISYFACCHWALSRNLVYKYKKSNYKNGLLRYGYNFVNFYIESPIFLLSLLTLAFLMAGDRGFGILFLFFLFFKTILFSFHRPAFYNSYDPMYSKGGRWIQPSAYWIFGVIFLLIYLGAIGYKKTFFYILEYKIWFIAAIALLALLTFLFVNTNKWLKRTGIAVSLLVLAALATPYIKDRIEDSIEHKLRLVKYRTSILTEPIENLLFDNEYSSNKEQKIIETAQGQWFINSYLNSGENDQRKIRLREHFNTGVDYTTQTRDVVIPRYVIAEFGKPVMALLLLLAAVPVVLFFLGYRIVVKERQFNTGSYIIGMALLLFFTLALFVWLTSTNRFVFFGQDFPFLSLTSRVSTLLPIALFTFVLLQKPMLRQSADENKFKYDIIRWLLFFGLVTLVIFTSGKSPIMTEKNFSINFSGLRNSIEKINEIYAGVQQEQETGFQFTEKDFRTNSDKFFNAVQNSLDALFADRAFLQEFNDATTYEQSILMEMKNRPRLGFMPSSPAHLIYDSGENLFKLIFNQNWHLELPAYNVKEVWQGDIMERVYSQEDIYNKPRRNPISDIAQVIVVPSSYLEPGQNPVGLLLLDGPVSRYDSCYIFDRQLNTMRIYQRREPVALLNENNIVFLINVNKNYYKSWPMRSSNTQYFAYNFLINGHQKHIYPMGDKFYWIRHWTSANKSYFEDLKQYGTSTSITLDYDLNKKVNSYLQASLKSADLTDVTFSVAGADGQGQIRLLADYVAQREIIDPNNDRQVAQKQYEQYAYVDSKAERLQWGNQNLLRMELGPGSSLKPIVSAAVTSQLKAEWKDLVYEGGELGVNKQGKSAITHYAGLDLRNRQWPVEGSNGQFNFINYLSASNNLYHSLIMFLGSYEKEDFLRNGNYSLKNILQKDPPGKNVPRYPIMSLNGETYYFPGVGKWPLTHKNLANDETKTWFGNNSSLLANGLSQNFDLYVEPNQRNAQVQRKDSFSNILPDTVTDDRTWSTPETSHFFQYQRVAEDTIDNFSKGLRFPALGGPPWSVTPLHMVEMYGKLTSENPLYRTTIDQLKQDSTRWMVDDRYTPTDSYESFLVENIFKGMENALKTGTAKHLVNGSSTYQGFYLYAKTGTIGNLANKDNSKRFALIITKYPIRADNLRTNRFYVLYFTIGNAYNTDDSEKDWYWPLYKKTLDAVMASKSFVAYMK